MKIKHLPNIWGQNEHYRLVVLCCQNCWVKKKASKSKRGKITNKDDINFYQKKKKKLQAIADTQKSQ